MISEAMKHLDPMDTDKIEDLLLLLATREPNDVREMIMDAACLAYSKRVSREKFRETMILLNETLDARKILP